MNKIRFNEIDEKVAEKLKVKLVAEGGVGTVLVNGRISRRIGRLTEADQASVLAQLRSILP